MEFSDVFAFVKRYYQIFIVFTLIGILIGFGYSRIKPKEYESISKVVIVVNTPDKQSDYGYLATDQLSLTYSYLVTTQPILDAAAKQVGSTINPQKISVTPLTNTTILEIAARNHDPKKSAAIANALAEALVENSSQLKENDYLTQENNLTLQIVQVEGQIKTLETNYTDHANEIKQTLITGVEQQITTYNKEVSTLQQEISAIGVPATTDQVKTLADKNNELSSIQTQLIAYNSILTNLQFLGKPEVGGNNPSDQTLAHIQTAIDQYQSVYLTLLKTLEDLKSSQDQRNSSVVLIAPAVIPTKQVASSFLLNPVITGLIGLVLSIFFALFLQNSRTYLQTPGQISERLGLETLGRLHELSGPKRENEEFSTPIMHTLNPELINLRASLEIKKSEQPYKSLLLTSFSKHDRKASLASSLALNYAASGQKVLLVDADFAHPDASMAPNAENIAGLSDILFGNLAFTPSSFLISPEKNLKVLLAGNLKDQTNRLMNLEKLKTTIASCLDGNDIVIINGPDISDINTRILSASADSILLELQPGKTLLKDVQQDIQNLDGQGKSKLLGVVLNESSVADKGAETIDVLRLVKSMLVKK